MKIAPSILSADFSDLRNEVAKVENNGADYLHIDVMDGQFVPNITFGDNVVAALRPHSKLIFDVHMMVVQPERFIPGMIKAGADMISLQVESTVHIHGALQQIKAGGAKAGVVLNPGTPLMMIEPILEMVDYVLVMTVNPGFGGQSFLPECLTKVEELVKWRRERGLNFLIEVDGGVNENTIEACERAGVDFAVAGSYVYKAENPSAQIATLKELANHAKD